MKFRDTAHVIGIDAQGVKFEYWFRHHVDTRKTKIHIHDEETGETTVKEIDFEDAVEGSPVVEGLLHKVLRRSGDK